jgi:hypothetical protein
MVKNGKKTKRPSARADEPFAAVINSCPPDYPQYQGDDGNDQQKMYQTTCAIYKKPKYPADDQDNCNEIQ